MMLSLRGIKPRHRRLTTRRHQKQVTRRPADPPGVLLTTKKAIEAAEAVEEKEAKQEAAKKAVEAAAEKEAKQEAAKKAIEAAKAVAEKEAKQEAAEKAAEAKQEAAKKAAEAAAEKKAKQEAAKKAEKEEKQEAAAQDAVRSLVLSAAATGRPVSPRRRNAKTKAPDFLGGECNTFKDQKRQLVGRPEPHKKALRLSPNHRLPVVHHRVVASHKMPRRRAQATEECRPRDPWVVNDSLDAPPGRSEAQYNHIRVMAEMLLQRK
jgi:flagellar biosynthesis GTPase FlhF